MGSHRAERAARRLAPPPGRRRAEPVRPRYGRLAVLSASLGVTAVAMLGGVGVLPSVAQGEPGDRSQVAGPSHRPPVAKPVLAAAAASPSAAPAAGGPGPDAPAQPPAQPPAQTPGPDAEPEPAVPAGSGAGRRVVFDESDQRVWLVDDDETVLRTYLVSGSRYDNLDPGTYAVYSRSEDAVGIGGSGTMRYFVRFTQGDNGAAIGFHDIPVDEGAPVQALSQLGTPLSHGCIRQARADAAALWEFAPVGTEVDVVA